jgi:hypothetical protein
VKIISTLSESVIHQAKVVFFTNNEALWGHLLTQLLNNTHIISELDKKRATLMSSPIGIKKVYNSFISENLSSYAL